MELFAQENEAWSIRNLEHKIILTSQDTCSLENLALEIIRPCTTQTF